MLIRRRDIAKEPTPLTAPSAPAEPDPRIDQLLSKIDSLEKALAEQPVPAPAEPDPRIGEVLEAVKNVSQPVVRVPTSEWVFDVKRGPYNEIQNVYARRATRADN